VRAGGLMRAVFVLYLAIIVAGLAAGVFVGLMQH
jgi:hypothetical protein